MLTRIKGRSDDRLGEIGRKIHRLGLTPNRLSVLGLVLTVCAAILIYHQWFLTGVLVLALGCLADGLDGMVARATGTTSAQGGYLDTMIDRYSDILLFGALLLSGWLKPLGWGDWRPPWLGEITGEFWALGALTGALLTSFARASAERLGIDQEGVGLVERPERLLILVFGLLAGGLMGLELITFVLVILTFLGHFTVLQRARHFWHTATPDRKGDRETHGGST